MRGYMDDLREAGVASALAPLRESLEAIRRQTAVEAEIESLTMRLAALVGDRLPLAVEEAERREALFADVAQTLPRATEHPRVAALESVLHDAMLGRLG